MEDRDREVFEKLKNEMENIQVPDRLRPDFIEELLVKKGDKTKKRVWKRSYSVGVAAACCLLVCTAVYGLSRMDFGADHSTVGTAENSSSIDGNVSESAQEVTDIEMWQKHIWKRVKNRRNMNPPQVLGRRQIAVWHLIRAARRLPSDLK